MRVEGCREHTCRRSTTCDLSAGAGFVVALAGAFNAMAGLPGVPSSERISLDASGQVGELD